VKLEQVIAWLSDTLPVDAILTNGAGNYAAFLHRYFVYKQHGTQLAPTSGSMGYGFPASIGVQVAHPDSLVINVAGEASWLMNMQEMGTAMQYSLPVKQFILNNERLGMVRQWQELLHGERYSQSWSESLPDFVKLAEAFGAKGILCSDPADLDDAIMEMIKYNGPVIFDCLVEKHENCFPMIPSGKAHNEMLLGDTAIKGAIDAAGSVLV
jgi:acetolactate synthase-1/2/3 large subunit